MIGLEAEWQISSLRQRKADVRFTSARVGPTGTRKTYFIAALAHYALTHGLARNILLASQSHEALNNAAEAVLKLFAGKDEVPSILRVGNESVVSDRLMLIPADHLEQLYKGRLWAEIRERVRTAVLGPNALKSRPQTAGLTGPRR